MSRAPFRLVGAAALRRYALARPIGCTTTRTKRVTAKRPRHKGALSDRHECSSAGGQVKPLTLH